MRSEYRLEPCRSALNRVRGMPFEWSLNPYMGCAHRCTFCYVRAFERRADRPWDDRYGASIRVKTNVAQVLRGELARRSWPGDPVVVGAATDPYQPAEGRFRLTRACLEAFAERSNPYSVITRGPLIVRDLDVLREGARRAKVSVSVSVPSLDPAIARATEPGVAPPRARLAAVRALAEAGVRVSVALAPIVPGLTDGRDSLAQVVRAARDAGAVSLWANLLYLKAGTREHFLGALARHWPDEAARLAATYASHPYRPRTEQLAIAGRVAALAREAPRRASAPAPLAPAPAEPPVVALQLGLAFAPALGQGGA